MALILHENSDIFKEIEALDKNVSKISSKYLAANRANEKNEEIMLNSLKRSNSNSSFYPKPKRFKGLHVSPSSDSSNTLDDIPAHYGYETPKASLNLYAKTNLTDKISKLSLNKETIWSNHSTTNESMEENRNHTNWSRDAQLNFEEILISQDDSRLSEFKEKYANDVEMVELSIKGEAEKQRTAKKKKPKQTRKRNSKKEKSSKDIENELNELLSSNTTLRRSERLRLKKIKSLELEKARLDGNYVVNKKLSKKREESNEKNISKRNSSKKMKISNKLFQSHSKLL
jgi:hypothetical protein